MSLYNGPARGGNRGGKDQFNWESVKNDKDREFYLGHSVKASTGRWQKGKDILWYTREKKGDEAQQRADELAAIKAREEDLMAEAMGLKPKSRPVAKPKLDASEMADLMRKARGNDGEAAAEPAGEAVDHMPGLGFHAGDDTMMGAGGDAHEVLAGTGAAGGGIRPAAAAAPQARRLTDEELAKLAALEKKAAKRAKKAGKKAKQLAKEVRKEETNAAKRQQHERNGRDSSRNHDVPSSRGRSPSPEAERHHKRRRKHDER